MIPVAFYAPLKSPDHPTPSGDREFARALMKALRLGGFDPHLASDLRLFDKFGDPDKQRDLQDQAAASISDLVETGRAKGWRAWVTYHNYYKAPDLIGPAVCNELGIPYAQVESTRAKKRLDGPWANFAAASEAAADAADVIFYFTHRDAEALRDYAPEGQTLVYLAPFLSEEHLPPVSTRTGPILIVAMMRDGDKLDSYALIAESLAMLEGAWQVDIAGDGTARAKIEMLMQDFGDKVRFLGQVGAMERAELYRQARLLFWPGVNEAIGLTYLEAQAAGIPVLAQDRAGLRDVISPCLPRPHPDDGPKGLANALRSMLDDPVEPQLLRDHIASHHLLPAAAKTLRDALLGVLE